MKVLMYEDDSKCNLNQKWNNNKCWCEYKSPKVDCVCQRGYIWNPETCSCENGKYAGSIISYSVTI